MTTWGIVSTIRAPLQDVLTFAAWHLEIGAHRLILFLDEPVGPTLEVLQRHPRIRPIVTDEKYWVDRGKRPKKHQVRQVRNATRAYRRKADVDWLAHIDVDEFLVPDGPVDDHLAALPQNTNVARMRPMEALAPVEVDENHWNFKTLTLNRAERREQSARVWPTYGAYLNGGFLSHVAGKVFVRTGLPSAELKIHNFFSDGEENPNSVEFDQISLAHMHAKSWQDWLEHYKFRHAQGSYRADLKPERPREKGGLNLHELFTMIEADGGEAALRLFFDEVCAATPGHLDRLARDGLLRRVHLPLDSVREKHFGDMSGLL